MELKRNLLTVFYTILFLLVAGVGLFQMTNLIVSTVPNKYVVTSIIILGLIIYLIVAFFIKESDALRFIQKPGVLMTLLECLVVLICGGLFFYLQWMKQGMAPAVIYTLLLVSMYVTARFCGGRLCGILCILLVFYMLFHLSSTDLMTTGSAIDMLCFLIPFAVFTGFQRILVPFLGDSGFLLVASYLVLGFIFSLAIAINPLVCILLLGCVLSLFFASFQKEEKSILAKGVFSALFLIVFTIGLLFCIYFMIPDIFEMQDWRLDRNLPLVFRFETLNYIINKYTRPVIYLHLQSSYGILPVLLFFFTFLAGYYTIRKKTSYMGPLILSQVLLFVYYIGFSEGGSQFYSLYYLLPVFAVYGFSNTLLSDQSPAIEDATEQVKEEREEKLEFKQGEVNQSVSEPEIPEKEKTERVGSEQPEYPEQTEPEQAEPEPEELEPEEVKVVISGVSKKDEIPEWTIPEEFLQKSWEEEALLSQEEELPDRQLIKEPEEVSSVPEVDDTLDLDQFVAEEPAFVPGPVLTSELVREGEEEELVSAGQEEGSEDQMISLSDPAGEDDQIDMLFHNGSNDMEQFVSTGAVERDDSTLRFSEMESTEAEAVIEETEEETAKETVQETAEETAEEAAEEAQLNDLLERLDMSEPIKRMNESAQEDIADVIEREEEQVELSEALPLKPSKSALPKYKKPNFDFEMEPVSIPLDDQYSTISEYDEVPTVHELENQWKTDTKPVIETVATKVVEIEEEVFTGGESGSASEKKNGQEETLHSEQITRKSGIGKRSYHKITIR